MNRIAALALLATLGTLPLLGQTSQSDSQTLQQILVELRSMHNDVRLSSTTPILLAEYQVQQGFVARAAQRRDDLRSKLTEIKSKVNEVDTQIAKTEEDALTTLNPTEKKQLTDMAENLKSLALAPMKKQELDTTNDLQDADTALAKEQNTLTGIKDQLDIIVKKLQPAGN
jgi:hypothetical protein